jgi:hypothetical protein
MTGISDIQTTYYEENNRCIVKIIGEYIVEVSGTYAICGCAFSNADYVCIEWGSRFQVVAGDPSTQSFELHGMDVTSGDYVAGYDFYFTPGEDIDVTLLTEPFDINSTIVGIQHSMTWKTCEENGFCTPGHRKCIGDDVHKCNSAGTAYEYEYTCEEGYHCVNGACVEDSAIDDEIKLTEIAVGTIVLATALVILNKVMK